MASLLTVDEVADAASIYKAARLCRSLKDSKAGECQLHKPAQPRLAALLQLLELVSSSGRQAPQPHRLVVVSTSAHRLRPPLSTVQRASSLSWNFVIVVVFVVAAVN